MTAPPCAAMAVTVRWLVSGVGGDGAVRLFFSAEPGHPQARQQYAASARRDLRPGAPGVAQPAWRHAAQAAGCRDRQRAATARRRHSPARAAAKNPTRAAKKTTGPAAALSRVARHFLRALHRRDHRRDARRYIDAQ